MDNSLNLLEKAKIIYKNFHQTESEADLCEKYVYGRGKDLDNRLVDLRIDFNKKQYIKSRFKKYDKKYRAFFSNLLKKIFTIDKEEKEKYFLTGKNQNQIAIEKELIGTISRKDFLLDIKIEKCSEVEFAQDINQETNVYKNKKYIRIFENIPKESDYVIFYCYGLNDNVYSSCNMHDIYEYNCFQKKLNSQNKPFGFLYFNYTGICMSGNLTENGDISFVNDAILVFKYLTENFPDKKIIIAAECFGSNVASRVVADLNLDCISRNLKFENTYNVSDILYCAPYISSARLKKDQKLITKILMYFVSKNYRNGHFSKFSNVDVFEFIPSYINVIILQARNPVFKNKEDFFAKLLPIKVKNLFTLTESDNLVSFKQTYEIASKILKKNIIYFFITLKNLITIE